MGVILRLWKKKEKYKFELHVFEDKHWVVNSVYPSEDAAVGRAKEAVGKLYEQVKVVRSWERDDGKFAEKVIFEQKADLPGKGLSVQLQEAAPLCRTVEELYGLDSRICIGRVLRAYLEKQNILPTELMHSARHYAKLDALGSLGASALSHIAGLQAAALGEDSRARSEILDRLVREGVGKARDADAERKMPSVRDLGLGAVRARLAVNDNPFANDFITVAAMTRDMLGLNGRLAKFEWLLSLADKEEDAHLRTLVDGVLAECMDSGSILQELLGQQRDLGTALLSLTDLARGRCATGDRPETDSLVRLNRLFGAGRLPQGQKVLTSRIAREIKGTQAFTRDGQKGEERTTFALIARYSSLEGFTGGTEMADAFLARAFRWGSGGRTQAEQQAFSQLARVLSDRRGMAIHFLLATETTPMGQRHPRVILSAIDHLLQPIETIYAFCGTRDAVRDKLLSLAGLQRRVFASTLPEEDRQRILLRLDALQSSYLTDEEIIEKFDNVRDPLRQRAIRLVQFCASGLLTEPKAIAMGRSRVVEHLRQADFVEKFTEGVADPGERERMVRDFYKLMAASGFQAVS